MGMIADSMIDEWYSSLPRTEGIYRIIDKTMIDSGSKERIWAVIALGDSGDPRAVRPLMDCCSDKDSEIRFHASESLHKLRSGRAVNVLLERLKDKREWPKTRKRAAAALAAIGSFSAIEGLKERSADADEEPALRSFITEELSWTQIR